MSCTFNLNPFLIFICNIKEERQVIFHISLLQLLTFLKNLKSSRLLLDLVTPVALIAHSFAFILKKF